MKILILSCHTGEGHNSAAKAIAEAISARGGDWELADPVAFKSERARRFVAGFYNGMIKKTPAAFGALYQVGRFYSATGAPSPVYYANATYAARLYDYIRAGGFDAVISTHLYGMEAMTAVHRRFDPDFPSFGVMTDYTSIPFFSETVLTGYFVAKCGITSDLVSAHIPQDRIYETGIPVSARFRHRVEKAEARRLLGLPADEKNLLVMTGGVGCEGMLGLCGHLSREGGRVYVLAGRNEKLRRRIQERFGSDGSIQALGFTEQVDLYMNAADALITKPGGLSTTEAAVAGVPIVHFKAIPGCETCNAEFFSRRGMSVWAKSEAEAAALAWDLAENKTRSEAMLAAQRRWIPADAADEIVKKVMAYGSGVHTVGCPGSRGLLSGERDVQLPAAQAVDE